MRWSGPIFSGGEDSRRSRSFGSQQPATRLDGSLFTSNQTGNRGVRYHSDDPPFIRRGLRPRAFPTRGEDT